MLPWLFAVLLVLNLALFWWGKQHEVPIEPRLPPIAEAPHQIQLLAKLDEPPAFSPAAEPPESAAEPVTPDHEAEPEPLGQGQSVQETALSEDEIDVPDEGAQPDPPPVNEQADALANEDALAGAIRTHSPNPPTAEDAAPVAASSDETEPGLEAALPAAATAAATTAGAAKPKATKKRKAKRRSRKPPPESVEPPPEFQ